jgi:prepilin-type N-terminal cleavage/methylation domain-containing protein
LLFNGTATPAPAGFLIEQQRRKAMSQVIATKLRPRDAHTGFTLVELLVVIAIIGILVGLLLPAVQAARESARRGQCQNHLKQIGIAWHSHESTHGFFPGSGWSPWVVGDPLLGAGREQPGGWMYQILPFIEEEAIYRLPDDGNQTVITPQQRDLALKMQESPVTIFNCPSRRPAKAYGFRLSNAWTPHNSGRPMQVARGDYAANAGDGKEGPKFWVEETQRYEEKPQWYFVRYDDVAGHQWPPFNGQTGINYLGADIRFHHISDGTSNTYMVGEKNVNPDAYESDGDVDGGDNHSYFQGFDWDVHRWATDTWPLVPDTPGLNVFQGFGSAHPAVWQVVMCDGSIRGLAYSIDNEVHKRLANRLDGLSSDDTSL